MSTTSRFCEQCGTALEADALFCQACGHKTEEPGGASPAPTSPALQPQPTWITVQDAPAGNPVPEAPTKSGSESKTTAILPGLGAEVRKGAVGLVRKLLLAGLSLLFVLAVANFQFLYRAMLTHIPFQNNRAKGGTAAPQTTYAAPPAAVKSNMPAQATPPAQPPGNNKEAAECVEQGDKLQKQKDYDGAIAQYDRAIELDPNNAVAYSNRGIAKGTKNDTDGAIADFTSAIKINPKLAMAYRCRGVARKLNGDLDGAIADFTSAIEINPKFALAYRGRGDTKLSKKDYIAAIADFTRAIELNPKYADAYNDRGVAKKHNGDLDGAIADFTSAIEINPKNARAYNNRGDARKAKGWASGALADYNTANEINKGHADAPRNPDTAKEPEGDMGGGAPNTASGSAGPSAGFQLSQDNTCISPDKTVSVEQYSKNTDDGYLWEMWTFDRNHGNGSLLNAGETLPYSAGFRFTNDSQWLVRMQKLGSGWQTLYLYHHRGDRFEPATAKPLGDLAWDYFLGLPEHGAFVPASMHNQVILVKGLEDNYRSINSQWPENRYLVISLSASGASDDGRIDAWRCVYDLQQKAFSVPDDFKESNRQTIRLPNK